jgi:hypothetical protein
MGPTPAASPPPGTKSKESYQDERERRLQIKSNTIERIRKENQAQEEALRARGYAATDDERATLILIKLYNLFGLETVFIAVPYGTKERLTRWKHLTWGQTQSKAYQADLIEAIKRGGNIAVVLGPASGDLCAIDVDDDCEWDCFLAGNPVLQEKLRRRGWHGGQVFFRMKPEAIIPPARPFTRFGCQASQSQSANGDADREFIQLSSDGIPIRNTPE